MVDAATHESVTVSGPALPAAESDGAAGPRAIARTAGPLARLGRRLLLSEYFVLWLMIVYFLALLPFLPTLSNPANLANILSNVWPLLAVAVGQTFVLTIAGIDLSQGAVVGLTSVVLGMLVATHAAPEILSNASVWGTILTEQGGLFNGLALAVPFAIIAMLATGALVGLLNGIAVAYFRMPAFMVTLVAMIVFGAFALWLTQSENISDFPPGLVDLGKSRLVSIYLGVAAESRVLRRELYPIVTYPMLISLALAVAAHFLLSRTTFGRHVFAIGLNRKAAEISGVPASRVIVLVFVISGFCAAVGSLLYSTRLETGMPSLGQGAFLLDVIGATVIGGISLFGGKAKIVWTFLGVLFFALLSNTLNLMNLSSFHIDMMKGAVILSAALLDAARRRIAAREA
jgi:ribose/xylose/arabinose/galactoside ABC-type transport system permease subunit